MIDEPDVFIKGEKIRDHDDAVEVRPEARMPALGVILGGAVLVVLFVITLVLSWRQGDEKKPEATNQAKTGEERLEANFIRSGWKRDAYHVLGEFIKATSVEGKLPYVLHADELQDTMKRFYGEGQIQDFDTPAEAFSVYDLPEDDRKNGMFMLVFDQPPQLDMRNFFRPIASLEVQYGLTEADLLLSSMAQVANFALEPLRVHAFFKKTGKDLKLDWEVFAQTKYRTLRRFLEAPEAGHSSLFRLFIAEDVPERGLVTSNTKTYRIADPANMDDAARIMVAVDSDVGRALAPLNWIGVSGGQQITRTATVELEWRSENNEVYLAIKRFVCWQFLGLGGVETKADPIGINQLPAE